MRVSPRALLSLAILAGCASQQSAGDTADGKADSKTSDEDGDVRRLLRPDQIYHILENSPILYEIDAEHSVSRQGVSEILDGPMEEARSLSAYLELVRDDKNRPRLVVSNPPDDIAAIHNEAFVAFSQERFADSRDLYARAAIIRPDYFKTFTYLGNAHLFLGELDKAERALLRAIELNPIDYQAHLFLGSTYYRGERYEEAKYHMTKALLLNPTSKLVHQHLEHLLEHLRLKMRSHRLNPRVSIERQASGKVTLSFDQDDGLRWFPLVNCLACWQYERGCQEKSPESELPIRLPMYRECLLNQAMGTAVRLEGNEPVGSDERALLEAVHDGLLEPIIFWEIVAPRMPVIMLLLSEELRQQIIDYINKYVFAPAQTA